MIQYERIHVSEGIDLNKTSASKACMICRYFLDIGCKCEQYVCTGCHDLSMMVYDLDCLMILNVKGVDYKCFVFNMSKNDAIKLLNNSCLDNKGIL